jgi:hypothetical protein
MSKNNNKALLRIFVGLFGLYFFITGRLFEGMITLVVLYFLKDTDDNYGKESRSGRNNKSQTGG